MGHGNRKVAPGAGGGDYYYYSSVMRLSAQPSGRNIIVPQVMVTVTVTVRSLYGGK